jgi:hypothetical protein
LPFFQISISDKDHSGFPTRVKIGATREYEIDEIFDKIADTACSVGRKQGLSENAIKWTAPDGSTVVI